MITDNDIRKIRRLKSGARLAPTQIKWLNVAAWRIGISVNLHDGLTQWAFSARLLDTAHSTGDDWMDLGGIIAVIGAPDNPIVPISDTNPADVHHWAWLDGLDGKPVPLTLEKELVNAIREKATKESNGKSS
jgi:hypothetical protein